MNDGVAVGVETGRAVGAREGSKVGVGLGSVEGSTEQLRLRANCPSGYSNPPPPLVALIPLPAEVVALIGALSTTTQ
jgi:hypothetical protein